MQIIPLKIKTLCAFNVHVSWWVRFVSAWTPYKLSLVCEPLCAYLFMVAIPLKSIISHKMYYTTERGLPFGRASRKVRFRKINRKISAEVFRRATNLFVKMLYTAELRPHTTGKYSLLIFGSVVVLLILFTSELNDESVIVSITKKNRYPRWSEGLERERFENIYFIFVHQLYVDFADGSFFMIYSNL